MASNSSFWRGHAFANVKLQIEEEEAVEEEEAEEQSTEEGREEEEKHKEVPRRNGRSADLFIIPF